MEGDFESLSAKAHLVGLSARASELRRQLLAQENQAQNPMGGSLIDVGIGALVPYGLKGVSRKFVRQMAVGARRQRSTNAHEVVGRLVQEARSFVAQYSILPANMPSSPQAGSAGRKLGSSLDTGSPVTRLMRLERSLNSLSLLPLVENSRIPEYERHVEFERAKARARTIEPDLTLLINTLSVPATPGTLESRFRPFFVYGSVREPLEGAIRSLERGTPEDCRQGLNSLRVALDALIAELSKSGEWKTGVNLLLLVEEERKIALATHHYYSRASHHGSRFDRANLLLGIDLFVSVGSRLVERAHSTASRT